MRLEKMEHHIQEAQRALDASREPGFATVLAPVATAHALVVLAECAYRREMREGQ